MQSMSELTCVVGLPSRTCSFFQLEAHTLMAVNKGDRVRSPLLIMPVSQPLPLNVVIIIIIIIIIIITFIPFLFLFSFSFSNIILCFDGSC